VNGGHDSLSNKVTIQQQSNENESESNENERERGERVAMPIIERASRRRSRGVI
jgi:hypothetical protein